ncbi:hypothetical protein [Nostoc sp. MG11]|uniref:hypothetical protein n=1 Tax=Nostoc sp. MG11 TaxID=2721166 RepID=UPI001D02E044|nr:hypothetical protein [Nostoc sp. MG11]
MPNITLRQVEIKNALVDLQFWREGDITRWDASVISGEVNVKQQAWQPWHNSTNFS